MKETKRSLLALIAIVSTVGALWFTNRPVTTKKAAWEDVVAESEMGGYQLIRTAELWKRISKNPDNILLVDTRQEWEYRTGHIKGAVNFSIEPTWLARWRRTNDLEAFLGTNKERTVVFY